MKVQLGFGIAFAARPGALVRDEVLGVGDNDFYPKSTAAMPL